MRGLRQDAQAARGDADYDLQAGNDDGRDNRVARDRSLFRAHGLGTEDRRRLRHSRIIAGWPLRAKLPESGGSAGRAGNG